MSKFKTVTHAIALLVASGGAALAGWLQDPNHVKTLLGLIAGHPTLALILPSAVSIILALYHKPTV